MRLFIMSHDHRSLGFVPYKPLEQLFNFKIIHVIVHDVLRGLSCIGFSTFRPSEFEVAKPLAPCVFRYAYRSNTTSHLCSIPGVQYLVHFCNIHKLFYEHGEFSPNSRNYSTVFHNAKTTVNNIGITICGFSVEISRADNINTTNKHKLTK